MNIVLNFMNLFIDGLAINHHELVEGRGGESFDFSIIEVIFFLSATHNFFALFKFIIYVVQNIHKSTKNPITAMIV